MPLGVTNASGDVPEDADTLAAFVSILPSISCVVTVMVVRPRGTGTKACQVAKPSALVASIPPIETDVMVLPSGSIAVPRMVIFWLVVAKVGNGKIILACGADVSSRVVTLKSALKLPSELQYELY